MTPRKPNADALTTKQRLNEVLEVASQTKGSDPFANVLPKRVGEPSVNANGNHLEVLSAVS